MYETYTVKPGDTLYGISNQFGVTVTELAELNGIKGSNLPVGTVLRIPNKSGTNPDNMFMYTVKPGDSLYSIARKYNTTVQDIINLNYLKNNNLSVGQVIRIPENYFKLDEMTMPNYISYTVKPGDTLYSIAANNGVSVDTIISDNVLPNNSLSVGQVIRIPENYFKPDEMTMPNYISYTVKPGDTLYSIAANNGVSVDTIISDNVLPNNSLSVGQVLRLRVSDGEVLECFGSDFDIPEEIVPSVTYVVKAGDNLYNIANKYILYGFYYKEEITWYSM